MNIALALETQISFKMKVFVMCTRMTIFAPLVMQILRKVISHCCVSHVAHIGMQGLENS